MKISAPKIRSGNGAELLVRCLEQGGIDTVYALPGEETNDLMEALSRSSIRVVLCRHEQSAAFMASVHGRLTGQPAACLSTLGPGATNLITGVADATLDCVPLVAITGQGARARVSRGRHSHQILDLERLFEPVTKYSKSLGSSAEIPGIVAEALRAARSEVPGAVHLSLPEDLAAETAPEDPVDPPAPVETYFNPEALSGVINALQNSEQPIILAGAGVLRSGAEVALRQLVEGRGLPLATSFMAKGLLPADHPQHLGAFGLPVEDHVDRAIGQSDLVVAIGLDPVEYPLEKLLDPAVQTLVSIASSATPRDLGWPIGDELLGDLCATLSALGSALPSDASDLWPGAQEARAAYLSDINDSLGNLDVTPPPSEALVAALSQSVTDSDLILSGVGTHKLALARGFQCKRPGQIIIANGLAGMGLALPGAIAAAQLEPKRRVIAVCGDGDVMMNVQDMETATRLDIELTIVVWVDGGYGLIEDKQEADTGTRPDYSFEGVDWRHLAAAFGWHHVTCGTARDLMAALADPDISSKRRLISVPVQYSGNLA